MAQWVRMFSEQVIFSSSSINRVQRKREWGRRRRRKRKRKEEEEDEDL